MEEFNSFSNAVFYSPSPGVVSDQEFKGGVQIIGNQESRLGMTVFSDNDLPNHALVVAQRDHGFMNQGVGELSFGMRDMNTFPRGHLIKMLDELFSPSPKGKEFDVLLVQLRELSIACKFGIKHQGWFHSTMDAFPEREEVEDLILGFGTTDIGCGIEHQFGVGVLGKEGQGSLHGFSSSTGPVLFQDGLFSIMRDGVEIEVDHLAFIKSQAMSLFDKSLLESEKVDFIQGVGIGGEGRTFGDHIETGEGSQSRIEGLVPDMGIAFCSQQFEGQKRKQVVFGSNDLASG